MSGIGQRSKIAKVFLIWSSSFRVVEVLDVSVCMLVMFVSGTGACPEYVFEYRIEAGPVHF
ncbi:hypothetical protein M6B38_385565 [Iris pallida]|uniref:Uncharacterized protein n=1 Tax=Iris pallida TaxID=29817 RepID=A0AAX6G405_IRIPA|nr:hypothetical protein M6B38_385565 [Iris pallida]